MLGTKLLISAALLGAALAPAAVQAAPVHHYRHGVDPRLHRQDVRIDKGLHNGRLTDREAARLEARDARLRAQEVRLRHSGHKLTRAERARLEREENRSSRAIYHQKHDAQHRH